MRFRQALRGRTYRRSKQETRGRKPVITRRLVHKINYTRKRLQKKANGEREVRWEDIRRASRAPRVHRTTVSRAFQREGIAVQARRPRTKPDRTPLQAKARVEYCEAWSKKPASYCLETVDMTGL